MRNAICGAVTALWVVNILADMSVPSYEPNPAINGVFSAMIGAVFAAGAGKKDAAEKGKDP